MKFKTEQIPFVRSFFRGQRAKLVELATKLQEDPPVHAVTRAEFERALERFVDADPTAYVNVAGIITTTNLRDPQNAVFLDPMINDVLRGVPPPPAPPPKEAKAPKKLATGGILCQPKFAGEIGRSAGLSPSNALNAAQCGSVDGEAYPSFTPEVPMYHKTVNSRDREGKPDPHGTGIRKITFFYEKFGEQFYFVAAGVHTSNRTYRITHVVSKGDIAGQLKKGSTVDFSAPKKDRDTDESVAFLAETRPKKRGRK